MSRTLNNFAPVALLLAVVALQACSTTPEAVPVTEPAPVEAVVENTPAPEIAPEPAPAQVAVAEQPQVSTQMEPKKIARKVKKTAARKPAPEAKPAPVIEPEPIVEKAAPVVIQAEPAPPVTMAPPPQPVAEPGFMEQYWLWIIGLVIIFGGFIVMWWRKNSNNG